MIEIVCGESNLSVVILLIKRKHNLKIKSTAISLIYDLTVTL